MRAISSLRDITMRVLILTAFLACVSAAPSYYAPVPFAAVAVPSFAVAPTIPPGDIQAAAINAQVKAEDQARFLADQARELAEQAVENQNEGVVEANDLVKEKSEEAFWAGEEKKWQAVSDVQMTEAKIDATAAENAAAIAKSYALTGVIPPVSEFVAAADVASRVAVESASSDEKSQAGVKSEAVSEVKEEKEALVKSAEIEKPVEPEAVKPVEAEKKQEAGAEFKSDALEALKAETAALQAQLKASLYQAPVAFATGYNYQPYVAPISYQPAFRSFPINTIHPYSAQIYHAGNLW